jgi:hypothetical protein
MTRNMKKVGRDASLGEKTVQAVARGDVVPTPRTRRRSLEKPPELIKDIKLHDMALAVVREIIDGPHGYTRYDIIDETTAVVR